MASFDCLPQEIIIKIFKDIPIYAFRKCKDRQGNYFPIIDQFIKDMYISEEAIFKSENFKQIDHLLRKTIYKSSIEDMIKKITLSYTQDYMKYVDDYGGIISYSKYIKETPVSLIVFRFKGLKSGKSDEVLIINKYCLTHGEDHFSYSYDGESKYSGEKRYYLYTISNMLSHELIYYKSIEIVKIFYPYGCVIAKPFDRSSPHEETILMKYL